MYTRRELGKLAITALPAATLLRSGVFAQSKPNSKVRGVMIGMNVPYNFGGRTAPVDEIIDKCVQLGVSGLELRTQPVEAFLGLPDALVTAAAAPAGGRNAQPSTPEQDAARKAAADEIRKWRLAVPMDKAQALRKKFEDAGILVEIVKVDNILSMADEVIDYEFRLAKALGARAISTEITHIDPKAPPTAPLPEKRLGAFADKHNLMVGYHGHAETGPKEWKEVFSYARHNGANLDIGHFIVGQQDLTGAVPEGAARSHHARPREGSDVRRPQRPVRHRRHADQGSPAADPRQQVADPGHHRVRVPGPGRLRSDDGVEEVRGLLPGSAGMSGRRVGGRRSVGSQ